MHLYLVRHGEAKSPVVDSERHLTESGAKAVERLAEHLRPLDIDVDAIYHSGKARAMQTAQILADTITSASGIIPRKGLAPTDSVKPILQAVQDNKRDVMLVGHLPFMAVLAGLLLHAREDAIAFHEATIACFKHSSKHGWHLEWSIHPGVVGR